MHSPFSYLFENISRNNFIEEYFDKKPLLVKGRSEKFQDIFTKNDFNTILNTNQLLYPKVRVTDHHNTIHKYDLIDDHDRYTNNVNNLLNKEKILYSIARGGTLVFDKIQEHSISLEYFIDSLSNEMNTHIDVNGYYTASNKKGVNPHFDRHDVIAIQIHGTKRWYYREDEHVLSKSMRFQKIPAIEDDLSGWKSVLLEQGDIFYCPRGLWHFTRTEEQHSLHLAVGLYPLTLKDWFSKMQNNAKFSEILEVYIREPFQPMQSNVNNNAVNDLIELLLFESNQPFDLKLKARPYIELE